MYSLISVGRTESLTKKAVGIIETITFRNICSPCVGRTNVHQGKGGQARQAKEKEEDSSDSDGEEVKAARVGTATPPFML